MGHYRVYKLRDDTRRIVKGKDLTAPDDAAALDAAEHDPDCPLCEVWRGDKRVGSVEHDTDEA